MKKCSACHKIKPLTDFWKVRKSCDTLRCDCKECVSAARKKYYDKNKEKILSDQKEWRANNPEEYRKRMRSSSIKHVLKNKERSRRWYLNNIDRTNELSRIWRESHPESVKLITNKCTNKRRKRPKHALSHSISSSIIKTLRKGAKGKTHWEDLLGYTVGQLMKHLERQFTDGMDWSNYGLHGWHIDHKIPISAFNFETPDDLDFKQCWALRNLRPLWAVDNIKKKDKLEKPFQPSLTLAVSNG